LQKTLLARGKIVEAHNLMAVRQQAVDYIAPDETGCPGDEDSQSLLPGGGWSALILGTGLCSGQLLQVAVAGQANAENIDHVAYVAAQQL
jgi:hypothetical protein